MRTCWVLHMWKQADSNIMDLKPMTEYGWMIEDDKVSIIWDQCTDNQRKGSCVAKGLQVRDGLCNWAMQLQKKEKECSEGCQCLNCTNISTGHDKDPEDTEINELVLEESQKTNDEVDELMDWVFGEETDNTLSPDTDSEEEDTDM